MLGYLLQQVAHFNPEPLVTPAIARLIYARCIGQTLYPMRAYRAGLVGLGSLFVQKPGMG